MFYKLFFLFSFILYGEFSFSQLQYLSTRDIGMAGSTAGCLSEGIPLNIAATSWNKNSYLSITAVNKYYVKDLSPVSIAFSKSFKDVFAIKASAGKMGNSKFSEQFIEAGISKKLGQKFSAGINFHFHQWLLNEIDYQSSNAFIPEAGIFTSPFKDINIGVIIRNPVRVRMNNIETKKLPAVIHSGISIKISQKTLFAFSLKQQSDLPISIQSGIEYSYHSMLILRAGYHTLPSSETFGVGLCLSKFQIDLSIETHPQLGITSSISITCRI